MTTTALAALNTPARKIMGAATRAGITKESLGQEHNMARRAESAGDDAMEIRCLTKALEIAATWGKLLPESYGASPATIVRIEARLRHLLTK